MKSTFFNASVQSQNSVSFAKSEGRKIGKPIKYTKDLADKKSLTKKSLRKYSELCPFPTSGTGITRKNSILDSLSDPCGTPTTLRLSLTPIMHPQEEDFEKLEEDKFTGTPLERYSEHSTQCEPPIGKQEPQTPRLSSPHLVDPKCFNRLSEKDLRNILIDVGEFMPKSGIKGKTAEHLKAYKEFLYCLFQSMCLVKQVAHKLVNFPLEKILNLPRPSGLESIFEWNWNTDKRQ